MTGPRSLRSLSKRFHQRPVIQLPGRPRRVDHFEIGGPEDPADRRLQLNTETLKHLLKIAEASEVGVVVMHHAGLEVSVWQDDNGHRYEQVTIIGSDPEPRRVPTGIEMPLGAAQGMFGPFKRR